MLLAVCNPTAFAQEQDKAAIGAITGDAGQGAAIGATAGGMHGVRAGRQAQAQQNQQAQANAAAAEEDIKNTFIKAFSA